MLFVFLYLTCVTYYKAIEAHPRVTNGKILFFLWLSSIPLTIYTTDSLEKGKATHFSILARRIAWNV